MTEPTRPLSTFNRTESEAPGPLDPTLVRPDGSFVLPPIPGGIPFGPPEEVGDLGRLGRYRVLKKLGEGGMGAVYLGADTVLTRRVALKVMLPQYAADPEARGRFLREARAAAMVHSDHVVTIHDVGEERGIPFIAMEHLQGYPLDRFLQTQGTPSLANVIRIGRETALGLLAAHKLGLIHRDIKPGNIWLEAPKGRVKLLDFGLARAANDDTHLTTSGLVVGTPAFMSPEQARNLKLDPRSDLFSLGVMLYRLATGRMPFEGTTTMAVLTSLAVDTPTPPRQVKPTVPAGLEAVITKLLAKNPDDRYQTAREVVDAFLSLERQKSAPAQPPVDAAPMAISAQFEVADDKTDESGSRARIITETVETESDRKKARGLVPWLLPAVYVAVCAVVVALAALLFWPTKGTLVVESDAPDAELVIKRDGVVVRERTRERELRLRIGSYTAELADPKPGISLSPERFEIKAREPAHVRVRVTAEPPPLPAPETTESDRQVAEWVLRVGGAVRIVGEGRERRTKDGLPPGLFRINRVNLSGSTQPTDTGLAYLQNCTALTELHLAGCDQITNEGLAAFRRHTTLIGFDLSNCSKVGDAGLAHLRGCKKLDHIALAGCPKVTNAGLAQFGDCTELKFLNLNGCPEVSDAGLVHLKGCKQLKHLLLDGTGVTDSGLAQVKGCSNLLRLEVRRTKTSLAKLTEFSWSVPRCRILYDGGAIEVDPDRRAAQYARFVGGTVSIEVGGKHRDIKEADELPGEPFALVTLNLSRKTTMTNEGLIVVTGCRNIRHLYLNESIISDAGLAHFAGLTTLTRMDIYRTGITGTGLANFRECKNLAHLAINYTKVDDEGLVPFRECKIMTALFVHGTKVTRAGAEAFNRAVPRCRVEWGGGVIEPKK